MKIVINRCYGGFALSDKAIKRLSELKKSNIESVYSLDRCDPHLVQVVSELKEEANVLYSNLIIVEIPDNIDWEIDEYDGFEKIHEKHRSWP